MTAHRDPATNRPMYPIPGWPFPDFYTSQCQEAGHTFECRPNAPDSCVYCEGTRPPPMFIDDGENVVFSSTLTQAMLVVFEVIATRGDQSRIGDGREAEHLNPLHEAGLVDIKPEPPYPWVLTLTGARYWGKIVAARAEAASQDIGGAGQ